MSKILDKKELMNHIDNLIVLYDGDLVLSDLVDKIKSGKFDSNQKAITEKQKEEIEKVTKRMKDYELQAIKNINLYESLKAIAETQKEEIAKLTTERDYARLKAEEAWKEDDAKETHIESLKAIAELALKGLKYYSQMKFRCESKFCDGGVIAKSTLFEIKRLENAQT